MSTCKESTLRTSDLRTVRCARPAGHRGACRCPSPLTCWPSPREFERAKAERVGRKGEVSR